MSVSASLIREARAAAGLTQAELARRAGTSQPTIAAYESGDKTPTAATLERVLQAAGSSLALSRWEGDRQRPLARLIRERRQEILQVAAQQGARNVRVFGSVARGSESSESDIDLLVDMEPGRTLLDQVRLRRALTRLLGVEVELITSAGLLERDRPAILDKATPI